MSNLAEQSSNSDLPIISLDQAKEYDHIILVDKSGSMGEPSTSLEGKTRWDEAREFTEGYARFAEQADDDGLTVITFNSSSTVYDGVKADKVHEVFTTCRPGGSTNLAGALDAAFKKKFSATKPAIILVLTDGAPDSQSAVKQSIISAANKIEKDAELAIQFVQIGDDKGAHDFLVALDDDLVKQGAKFDIVNSLTRQEAEAMTIEQLLWQAVND